MKKTLLTALLFSAFYGTAQVRMTGTTINSVNSSAFIDASSNTTNNGTVGAGKGLVFPRVDLSTFSFVGTAGVPNNFPSRFDGMIVYNTAASGTTIAGSTQGTLSPGFWFYENKSTSITGGTWKPVSGTGPAGPQGPAGPAGPAGANGIDGAVGPQGPIGLTGPAGPQGPAGANGVDGAVGPQGPIGLTGPAGPQGTAGSNGVDGAVGPQGPAGSNGVDGAVGPQGPIGLTGPAGPQGPAGEKGETGAVGPQGPAGSDASVTGTAPIAVNMGVVTLSDLGVSTIKIANDAVTNTKIADNAVTIAKLPAGATDTTFLRGDGTWAEAASVTNITATEIALATKIDGAQLYAVKGTFTASGLSALVTIAKPTGMTGYYSLTTYKDGKTYRRDISSFDMAATSNNVMTGTGAYAEVYPEGTYNYVLEYFK